MLLRSASETLTRKTTRRGLFGRGAEVAFGALLGTAIGVSVRTTPAGAGAGSACSVPGSQCPCEACQASAVCAKPCVMSTIGYSSGCWVTPTPDGDVMCCDCDCNGRIPAFPSVEICGCSSDFHNDPANCPQGTAKP